MKNLVLILSLLLVVSCSNTGRYSMRHDTKPVVISRDIDFKDVEPQFEPYLPASMRPYSVLGKDYKPLKTGKGYSRTGIASWYGQKFHGHLTANGEVYNMFAMSAAHKTLPLPSFVRITNLENGRQAVVRVNDRGPFHHNRIIDLSYAAAMKLGVLDTGTAKVQVDVIHVDESGTMTVGLEPAISKPLVSNQVKPIAEQTKALFIQVAALQDREKVAQLAQGLQMLYQVPVNTPSENGLYRLHLGPLDSENQASLLLAELRKNGYESAFTLYASL